ncbi:unnamed protein product, partial [Musa textilis]
EIVLDQCLHRNVYIGRSACLFYLSFECSSSLSTCNLTKENIANLTSSLSLSLFSPERKKFGERSLSLSLSLSLLT